MVIGAPKLALRDEDRRAIIQLLANVMVAEFERAGALANAPREGGQ